MDLYETLGVRRNATVAQIRRAFQKQARQLHPDLNPGDPVAASRYAAVEQAFKVLDDPIRRRAYDLGELVLTEARPIREVGFEGFDFSAEIRSEVVGFREIFDSAGDEAARRAAPGRGEDLLLTTRISFDEALRGTTRRLQVVRQETCLACRGSGDVKAPSATCQRCGGAGQLRARRGAMVFGRPCDACDGLGQITRQACARCQGEGRAIQSEWLEVTLPAGVGEGSEVRVPACGNAGRRGGASGDLVLRVATEAQSLYVRNGADLQCVVPVSMVEAALGGHIEVPTPDGSMVIEIPAGTQTGQRFRLRGRGMPRVGEKGRGDLFIEARVWVPVVDDSRGRELLEELARRHAENPRAQLLLEAVRLRATPAESSERDGEPEERDAASKTVSK